MKKNVFFLSLALLIGLSTWTAKALSTVQVGTGLTAPNYATIKAACDAINAGTLTGDVELQLTANTVEPTAGGTINASGTGSASYNSVTIYPSGGARAITSAFGTAIITIAGSNVTINGRIDKTGASGLSITNSAAAGTNPYTILINAPATATQLTNVRVEYCTISASNTSGTKGNLAINFTAGATVAIGNIYIQNNKFTGRSANTIFSKGVSALLPTSGLNISNNNFENCANLASASFGINVDANHTGATISNNNYYDNAFVPTGGFGITAISLGGNGHTISGNYIGGSAADHSGTLTKGGTLNGAFTGIALATTAGAASSIQGNTIAGISWVSTNNNFKGIAVSGAGDVNVGTVTGNTIGAATGTGSIAFLPSLTATFTGIEISTTGIADVQKNTIASINSGNVGTPGSTIAHFTGISKTAVAGTTTISNNTIGGADAGSINCPNTVASQVTTGISCLGTDVNTIGNNTISNITSATSGTTIAGYVAGIRVNAGTSNATTVNANFIQKLYLNNASTSGSVMGIYILTGLGTYTNNIININNTSLNNIYGIFDTGANASNSNIYHNTVYVAGVTTGALVSCALYSGASTNTRDIRNNIFSNERSGGTGKNYAVKLNYAVSTNLTLDHNDYYASSSTGYAGFYNNADVAKGTATIVSGLDAGSVSADPVFANASGTAAVNFKPATNMSGASTTGVTQDYSLTNRAAGSYAMGAWDVAITAPAAPTAVTFKPAADVTSLLVSFTAGADGGSAITDYKYSLDGGAYVSAAVTTSPITITGLTTATSHTVQIEAVNINGDGAASTIATGRVSQTVVYVNSTTGNDTNDGLTAGTPVLTVAKAVTNSCSATTNIYLAAGTYVQTSPIELSVLSNVNLTISGESASNTIISTATTNSRLIKADLAPWLTSSNTLTIRNLTLSGVNCTTASYGGAMYLQQGTGAGMSNSIILENLIVKDNTISNAGGFGGVGLGTNCKDVTITNCYFKNNRGLTGNVTGGAIYIGAPAAAPNGKYITISNTTFDGNQSTRGGAIYLASLANQAKTGNYVKLTNCTFVNNRVDAVPTNATTNINNGAAVYFSTGSLATTYVFDFTIANCTFAKNQGGPAVGSVSPAVWETKSAVHFDGTTGWGTTTLVNNIFAPSLTANCGTTLTVGTAESTKFTAGYNAIESVDALATDATFVADAATNHNTIGAFDPSNLNAALTDNSTGSVFAVPYLGLPTGSSAINAGVDTYTGGIVPSTDVRGQAIIVTKDLGAFEFVSTTPGAPSITGITAGNTQLTVNYTEGATGGSAITSYEYSINNGGAWTTTATNPFTISSLTNGTSYTVQLRALNVNGAGEIASSSATPLAAATVPDAPSISGITTGNSQLSVAFSAGGNGGSSITNYEYSTNAGVDWTTRSPIATTSPIVITGLTNGTSYNVQIRAVNDIGSGTATATTAGVPSTTPSSPTSLVVTGANTQLSVAFTAGADGGSAITNYEYSTNAGVDWTARSPIATTSPIVITGLTNGTSYNVQLRAVNTNGTGTATASSPGTPSTTPSAPTITAITAGNGQLSVAFTAGANGSSAITSYKYSIDNGDTFAARQTGTTASPIVITGLAVGTAYNVQIKAVNANGDGTATATTVGTTNNTPSAPTITGITANDGQLSVAFTAGATGGSAITNYKYSIDNGATFATRQTGNTASPIVITGLANGTICNVQIKAVNVNGDGIASTTTDATPRAQTKVYVSTTGVNTNDGLTAGTPVLTFVKAISMVTANTTDVILAAGTYEETAVADLNNCSGLNLTIRGESAKNTIIHQNTAATRILRGNAGTYVTSANTLTIQNLTFSNGGTSNGNGGAMEFLQGSTVETQSNLTIENVIFDGNKITNAHATNIYYGGALSFNGKNLTINNCYFKNNKAQVTSTGSTYGGAIYIVPKGGVTDGVFASISNTTFDGNEASLVGGAIFLNNVAATGTPSSNSYLKVFNCSFVNNKVLKAVASATSGIELGTAIFTLCGATAGFYQYDFTIANSTFTNNQGGIEVGSGLAWESKSTVQINGTNYASVTLVNNIIKSTATSNCGQALAVNTTESTKFFGTNNLIESVSSKIGSAAFTTNAVANNNIIGAMPAVNLNESLTDNSTASVFAVPYLELTSGSTAIGAGVNSYGSPNIVPTTDVRGQATVATKDLGAYESLFFSVPGAPTAASATAGNTDASVAFTAPANNGGSVILDYTVTSNPGNKTVTGASSPLTVTGLTNGTAYTFTVTARNTVGSSAASVASNEVTPIAPGIVTVDVPKNIDEIVTAPSSDVVVSNVLTVNAVKTVQTVTIGAGAKLDLGSSGTLTVTDLVLEAGKATAPSVSVTNPMAVTGTVKLLKTIDNTKWYFMSFPCAVDATLITQVSGSETMTAINAATPNWWIKYYDGENRAINKGATTNWKLIQAPYILEANKGYIIGLADALTGNYVLSIPLNKILVTTAESALISRSVPVEAWGEGTAGLAENHKGWNLVGLPYLSKFTQSGIGASYVNIHNGTTYIQTETFGSATTINPFGAFFVQASSAGTGANLVFDKALRQLSKSVVTTDLSDRVQLNFTSGGNADKTTLIMDNNQTTAYEINKDLEKMITIGTTVPQVYTMLGGINYAFNALPMTSVVNLPIGVYSLNGGAAIISANAALAPSLSKLILTDNVLHTTKDLLIGDYAYNATPGTDNSRFTITAQRIPTDNLIVGNDQSEPTLIINNSELIINNLAGNESVRVYDAIGRMVVNKKANSNSMEIKLAAVGMYTVQLQSGTKMSTHKFVSK